MKAASVVGPQESPVWDDADLVALGLSLEPLASVPQGLQEVVAWLQHESSVLPLRVGLEEMVRARIKKSVVILT